MRALGMGEAVWVGSYEKLRKICIDVKWEIVKVCAKLDVRTDSLFSGSMLSRLRLMMKLFLIMVNIFMVP